MPRWVCMNKAFANPDGRGQRIYQRGEFITLPSGVVPKCNDGVSQNSNFIPEEDYVPPASPVRNYGAQRKQLPSYRAPIDEMKAINLKRGPGRPPSKKD